jgi:hypothetical protein
VKREPWRVIVADRGSLDDVRATDLGTSTIGVQIFHIGDASIIGSLGTAREHSEAVVETYCGGCARHTPTPPLTARYDNLTSSEELLSPAH